MNALYVKNEKSVQKRIDILSKKRCILKLFLKLAHTTSYFSCTHSTFPNLIVKSGGYKVVVFLLIESLVV